MSKYINIDYSNGTFYHYSKEQDTPEYKEHVSSTGKKGYRRHYFGGVEGYLQNLTLQTNPQGRTQISLFLKDVDNEFLYVNVDAFTQKGQFTEYAESLIRFVSALSKGKYYKVVAYKLDADYLRKRDEEEGKPVRPKYYAIQGISFKEVEAESSEVIEKVQPTLLYKGTGDSIIPSLDFQMDPMTKKKKPTAVSVEERENFLKAHLMKAVEGHLKREEAPKNEQKPESPPEQVKETVSAGDNLTTNEEENYDDLPF
jgi:hypothetical protein